MFVYFSKPLGALIVQNHWILFLFKIFDALPFGNIWLHMSWVSGLAMYLVLDDEMCENQLSDSVHHYRK